MPVSRFKGMGYGTFCQRALCYKCKSKGCECPCHSGGAPDPFIIETCRENAINRAWLGSRCQEGHHSNCKTNGCHCKCHVGEAAPVTKIIKEDAPVASEENVLVLQERVLTAEANFTSFSEGVKEAFTELRNDVAAAVKTVEQIVKEYDQRLTTMEKAKKLEVKIPGKAKPIELGMAHRMLPDMIDEMAMENIPYLIGPAGGGKSEGVLMAHLALGRPRELFYPQVMGAQTTQSNILGYKAPNGECVHSQAFLAWKNGGTWFPDEIDAANGGVLTSANPVLTQKYMIFGCGCALERHPDTRFAVAANTFGKGADHIYIGRNQLDGASLDRFVFLNWDYDWDLTRAFTGDTDGWTTYCERMAELAAELKLRVVIGPRKALFGNRQLNFGKSREYVEERFWSPFSEDDKRKLLNAYERKYPKSPEPLPEYGEDDISPDGGDGDEQKSENISLNDNTCSEDAVFAKCPKCDQAVRDGRQTNKTRKAQGLKPIPQFKCVMNLSCKWKVWPDTFDWSTMTWKS